MGTVFKELSRLDETGNFGVLLTIIFVFLFYIIAIVLAKKADRKDQAKVTTTLKSSKTSLCSVQISYFDHLSAQTTLSDVYISKVCIIGFAFVYLLKRVALPHVP